MKKKKINYIVLLIIIIVACLVMILIGSLNKLIDNNKNNKSYIVNKVNNYSLEKIDDAYDKLSNNSFLYLSYVGDKNIYILEKNLYKSLKKNKIIDSFIYINCTDNINDKRIVSNLNDKLNIITDNEIVLPAIIYYKDGKPTDYIDSINSILTYDKFIQLLDKWEIDSND